MVLKLYALVEIADDLRYSGRDCYAIIKREKGVDGWPRIARRRVEDDLKQVSRGQYKFDKLEALLIAAQSTDEEADDSSE
jgi:hypothetical protein